MKLKKQSTTIMVVAFIGHRNVENAEVLQEKLTDVIATLIEKENADTFLFGSRSAFNNLCYEIVSKLKETYTNIKRIYVRATYEFINKEYLDYLLTFYDETFFPDKVRGAGKLSYVVRYQIMVGMCDVLVIYYNSNYKLFKMKTGTMLDALNAHKHNKSGTNLVMQYAQRKHKLIINVFE